MSGNRVGVRPQSRSRQWRLGLPQLWALVAVAGVLIVLDLTLVRPHDFWWHVRVGQWIVENGRVPTVDLFSYTRLGQPFAYEMWLMEVVLYLLYRGGGLPLVIFFHAGAITAGYGLLLSVNKRAAAGDLRWAAVATLAAAALGVDNWNVRPQTVSFLFFALILLLLERHEALRVTGHVGRWGDWAVWVLPPLFAVWANCHAAFVFGLVLLGADLAVGLLGWVRRRRSFPLQLFVVTGLSAAAVLLTPQGLGTGRYLLGIFQNPTIRALTVEWAPPTMRERQGQLLFGFVAIWVALLYTSRYRPTAREVVRVLLFGVLALLARRNVAWFGFVAAPTMAASLALWSRERGVARGGQPGRARLNLAIAALVGLLALLSLPWLRPYLPLPEWRRAYVSPETPVGAVAFLRDLPGPMRPFHSESYGAYMLWASPQVPVFVDTRLELYPLAQWDDYLALSYGRYDWEAILRRYGVDTLLLERETQEALVGAASAAPGWQRAYEDKQTAVFRQRQGP